MNISIDRCAVHLNKSNGISVQDYWKGEIQIRDTSVRFNSAYGLHLAAKEIPRPMSPIKREPRKQRINKLKRHKVMPMSMGSMSQLGASPNMSMRGSKLGLVQLQGNTEISDN